MALTRKILKKLEAQAKDRKISLLIGARQVGKTTLLKMLSEELSLKNKCLFLDLDILSNYEKISTFESLLNLLKINGYSEKQTEFFYLFLDEFQRYSAVSKIMKNVYDNLPNVKIFASGSSSLAIKNQIQESLAGRKIILEIFPLDFEEFLTFKNEDKLASNLKNLSKLKGDKLNQSLKDYRRFMEEFMIFGGYPEVALKHSLEEKKLVLESIFDLYVKKDLVEYLNINKLLEVKKLIEFLAINNGQKIKYEEISKITSLSFNEIKKYLEVLFETYLIKEIRPFYTNKNKELVKIPKIYFLDNGVRNYFINNFNELRLRNDSGFLFEGFILSELLKRGNKGIRFWQDKNFNEVDFILEKDGKSIPLEVKFKEELKLENQKSLNVFLESYAQVVEGVIINLSKQKKDKSVRFILPYNLDTV
ncbi:ATP-binding protein [Candidatus Woesearchaeota archaeon]|nr:ATP-binding protein [Candidatus Woesearchaeota archaeon]